MIPTKLRLKGFLSYQQETTLDFSTLHVACISGMNGAGKSSLLDAITWSLFGEARQRNDAIINLNSDEVFVELEFTYENNQYKIHRARQKEKSTQLDFYILANQDWKSLTERTIKDTQELITHTLNMDYDTFINASFFLQGKSDQFAKQTPGKRKEILTKILGLEKWEAYKTQALQQRRELEQQKRINDSRIEEKELELARKPHYQSTLESLQAEKTQLQTQLSQEEALLNTLQAQQRQIELLEQQSKEKKQALEKAQQSLQTIQKKIKEKQTEQDKNQTIIDKKDHIKTQISQLEQLQQQLLQLDQQKNQQQELQNKKQNIELKIKHEKDMLKQKLAQLQTQQKEFAQNQARHQDTLINIQSLETQLAQLTQQLQPADQLATTLSDHQTQVTDLIAENKLLQSQMNDLQAHIEQIQSINSPTCPVCEQELTPEHQTKIITENQTKGKILGDQYRANNQTIQTLHQQITTLQTTIKQNEKISREIALTQQKLEQVTQQNQLIAKIIDQDPALEIEQIQAQLNQPAQSSELQKQLALIIQQIANLDYDPQQHQHIKKQINQLSSISQQNQQLEVAIATQKQVQETLSDLNLQKTNLQDLIHTTQQEIETIAQTFSIADTSKETTSSITNQINHHQKQLESIKQSTYDNQLALGGANQALNNLTQIKAQKTELEQQTTTILTQIASLKEIEKAFSKEGIPALLIEQAIPEIENRANEILRKLTNDEMTISLITQEEYKDKKREDLKETMEIKIHDKFGTRDYELFSGGETFRINFALRLALSELLSKRAGAKLQTLVIDEGFGSQDQFGRQKLAEVINPIKEQFALILVITHIDSLKDAFPNRILVEKTPQGSIAQIA